MKEKVKIGFVDFWKKYEPENWFIYKALSKKYEIIIDNDNPDILFCSCFGNKKGIKQKGCSCQLNQLPLRWNSIEHLPLYPIDKNEVNSHNSLQRRLGNVVLYLVMMLSSVTKEVIRNR